MTWFVNYNPDHSVSVADRGLAYGDGVFETVLSFPQYFLQLDDHLSRLYRGLYSLGMPFSADQKHELSLFLDERILPMVQQESVVKIMVTRGEGGRGYLPPQHCKHSVFIGLLPAPDYRIQRDKGVCLSVSPVPVSTNRFLAGIKHLNRLENVLAKRFLSGSDFEAIMLDSEKNMIECIQSNLFWFKGNTLYTPALHSCGVQGTYRKALVSAPLNFLVQVGDYSIDTLESADEVFITNSLMGIVPVTKVADRFYPIGVNTLTLQKIMQIKGNHGVV